MPPITPGETSIGGAQPPPRMSTDRLRTLEFALEMEEAGQPAPQPAAPAPKPPPVRDDVIAEDSVPKRRVRPLALIGGAAAALVIGLSLIMSRNAHDAQDSIATETVTQLPVSTAPIAAQAPAAQPVREEPTTISVQLNNVPKGARVYIDDIPAAGNPLELARDGKNRVIKVTAPGKAAWQAVHHASANATFDVFMVPLDSGKSGASGAAQAGKSSPSTRVPTVARTASKARKKPPSALRTLDF
jgi:hypothetical protein